MSAVEGVSPPPGVSFDERNRPLFATERWGVLLYRNQTYLGRSIVFLRTRPLEDPLELTPEERDELWDLTLPRLAAALRQAFAPDRINYSHLANRTRHVHWHVVPRYEAEPERIFAGERFVDTRPGQIYRASKRGKVGNATRDAIADEIRRHLPDGCG